MLSRKYTAEVSVGLKPFLLRFLNLGLLPQSEVRKVFTGPVDGDGRGVHADGHGSLLLLEKLPRVPRPLSDDGLRLLETHTQSVLPFIVR